MAAEKNNIDSNEVGVPVSEGITSSSKKKGSGKPKASKQVSPKATPKDKKDNSQNSKKDSSKKGGKSSSGKKKKKKEEKKHLSGIKLTLSPGELSKKTEAHTPACDKPAKRARKDKSDAKKSSTISRNEERNRDETLDTNMHEPKRAALNVQVHRMRHLNFRPRAILHMATTPFNSECGDYIAISRENGSVELKSPDEKWRSIATIAGMSSKTVDVMTWLCGVRDNRASENTSLSYSSDFHKSHTKIHGQRSLIGASKDGTIFVVDFSKGKYTAVTGSGGGGIFALSSLPSDDLVAAGCEDGAIRIYKLRRSDSELHLDLVSTIPHAGSAVLSLAWLQNSGNHGMDGSVIYAGVADGTIRRYECKSKISRARAKGSIVGREEEEFSGNQTWISTVRMTVECFGRTTPTLVWDLVALADGTVVSGDSLGHVQFWDGKTGTMLQSFEQNDKKADVLSLAVTPDECKVFASGIDSRVICIERPTLKNARDGPEQWVITQAQRPHTHDVKSICIYRAHDLTGSLARSEDPDIMLCTGGVDTKICTYFVKGFKKHRPKIWFPWPTKSPISIAKSARVLLLQRESSLELHMLAPRQTESHSMICEEEKTFIGSLDIQSSHNIVCSDVSTDGKYVVASTGLALLLFKVYYSLNDDRITDCSPVQISLDEELKGPCLSVKFAPNDRIICVGMDGNIQVLKINQAGDSSKDDLTNDVEETESNVTVSKEGLHNLQSETVNTSFPVHTIAVAEDGKHFGTVRGGVGSGTVSIYRIENDCIQNYWSLPALEAPITCVAFLTGTRQELVATCSNFAVYVFSLKDRKLSAWNEKTGFPITPNLPLDLKRLPDFPSSILPHPKDNKKFILGSFGAFSIINMALAMPERCKIFPEKHLRGKKRKLDKEEGAVDPNNPNCTICMRYNSIIHNDFISDEEMVIVEQPWLSVFATLPGALERKVFGT
eukprot:CAMPEP_0194217950 /NCGR_PEP_ID=MMETSP0156-20130528/22581_1 /TAXON_ID=33649 /ORGANISM="Thalassionema nitzschioides, Strain L26-B" /LENGTH=948 /DNA_ID=CAMNT_0038947129 /DNA_START=26 /DNA_END=2872 /DNA_ORIENTATION=-